MNKKILGILAVVMGMMVGVMAVPVGEVFAETACQASDTKFLGMKPWFYYLERDADCKVAEDAFKGDGDDNTKLVKSIWTVGLTVLSDLFYVAGVLAVVLLIYGGYLYMTSGGDPGALTKAKKTITGTIVGLVIVILASVIVNSIIKVINGGSIL